jgi:hypothetical protein
LYLNNLRDKKIGGVKMMNLLFGITLAILIIIFVGSKFIKIDNEIKSEPRVGERKRII